MSQFSPSKFWMKQVFHDSQHSNVTSKFPTKDAWQDWLLSLLSQSFRDRLLILWLLMVSSTHGDEESLTAGPEDHVFIPSLGLAANSPIRYKMTDPLADPSDLIYHSLISSNNAPTTVVAWPVLLVGSRNNWKFCIRFERSCKVLISSTHVNFLTGI